MKREFQYSTGRYTLIVITYAFNQSTGYQVSHENDNEKLLSLSTVVKNGFCCLLYFSLSLLKKLRINANRIEIKKFPLAS